jgi:5'-deoxynucleotidase YfbR-like HD superfamily hydrolase
VLRQAQHERPEGTAVAAGLTPAILPLFRELGDLKRIRSAEREGSTAERLFRDGWAALAAGAPASDVMARTVAAALAAARLGDLDLAKLRALGLGDEAVAVLERSFDEVSGDLDPALAARLRPALAAGAPEPGPVPPFVDKLARQPRAGVTCPGKPRIMLQPPENHAEHCLMVAVYAVIAAPIHSADPVPVFVASMAHHLHSAAMPDSGFSGEVLLRDALDDVIAHAREEALAELDPALREEVRAALAPIAGDATPEARAFHVGDVLDRVLEIEQHLRAATVAMDDVLGDYGLVHDGPVKGFHDRILQETGLA